MRAKVSGLLIALVSGAASAESPAWIETAYYAFESAKAIGASSAGSHALVQKAYGMPALPLDLGVATGVPISALSIDGADVYFATKVSWRMDDALVTPRDVVKIASGGGATIFLRGSDMGLPPSVRMASLSVRGSEVLFSIDVHAQLGALSVRPSDVLSWNGATLELSYGANDVGIPDTTKLVGIERTGGGGLLMAFDSAATINGVALSPGDLIEYLPSAGAWGRARSRSNLGLECSPCDLTAIAADTDSETVFRNGLEAH